MNPCMQNCWLRPWEWNLDGSVNGSTRQNINPTSRNGTIAAESLWMSSQATLQKWASSTKTVHTSSSQSCGPARLQLSQKFQNRIGGSATCAPTRTRVRFVLQNNTESRQKLIPLCPEQCNEGVSFTSNRDATTSTAIDTSPAWLHGPNIAKPYTSYRSPALSTPLLYLSFVT